MLKMTNIKLELMTDIDMFQFIEKGMRGGVSYIANRYGKANNKYMKEYDEKAPSKYIMYLDANNLYGWAMSQYLPTGNLKWMTDKEISKLDLGKYKADGKNGLILEVDLEYPQELHDIHNDYPVTPEKVKVSNNMLSAYCKKIAEKYNISIGLVSKLIPTLRDKKEYVLHYRNLQLYLDLGLKIKKVHRVLKFNQSPWLKQYIDFNTEKRKHAKNSFEKDFFKLMNNSIFGKTMETLRNRVDVRLVTNEKKLDELTSKPTFVSSKIFNENLMAVHRVKETLTLNRPAYAGMCILDLSKTLMYDFHYNYIKKKYNTRARLLFTDTDSLTYKIEAEDVYKFYIYIYLNFKVFNSSVGSIIHPLPIPGIAYKLDGDFPSKNFTHKIHCKSGPEAHTIKLAFFPLLFLFIVTISNWIRKETFCYYTSIKHKYLFLKSRRHFRKHGTLFVFQKVLLFLLVVLTFDAKLP